MNNQDDTDLMMEEELQEAMGLLEFTLRHVRIFQKTTMLKFLL